MTSVRLFALLARAAHRAVIFRRGPSKQVLLIAWRTDADSFEEGQWLKGRIYERRCDLSPSGDKLIYFAATWKPRHDLGSWTAICRPPWLTAIAFWPKGDAWGGGGLFDSEWSISLNHPPDRGRCPVPKDPQPPRRLHVQTFGPYSGRGEDSPILDRRLTRDGWRLLQSGKSHQHKLGDRLWIELDPPSVIAKPMPMMPKRRHLELESSINGIHERNGAWYVTTHRIVDRAKDAALDLGRTEWAGWDKNGDLLFARGPKLFRLPRKSVETLDLSRARELADFASLRFEARAAPESARQWR
jgi:hypothetical protein